MMRLLLIILLLAACVAAPVANAADPERIIVTNARLVGRDSAVQDVAINILIVNMQATSSLTKYQLPLVPLTP